MSLISYAQNFEDVVLWRALHDVDRGRYIDVGAQDPELDSVSLAFYKAGWRGIHVEPTPFYAGRLREARPDEKVIEAVVTDAAGPLPFFEIPQTGISTGRRDIAEHHSKEGYQARQILAATVRLDELFGIADGESHWMKIDVEGMEADVLRSWGDSAARPWVLVLESTFPNTQEQTVDLWIDEVLRRGYDQVLFDGLSTYFVHEAHRELVSRFAAAANIFDRFSVTSHHFCAGLLKRELEESSRAREVALHDQKQALGALSAAQAEQEQIRDALKATEQERRKALDALTAAQQEHRERENRLVADAEHARASRDAAEREVKIAFGQVVAAEQSHRAALASQSRERQILEQEHGEKLDRQAERLQDAQAAANAANVNVARMEERCVAIQARLDSASDQIRASSHRLTVSEQAAAALRGKVEELQTHVSSSEQANASLCKEVDRLQELLAHADVLIGRAKAEPRGPWQRLGERLGVAKRSPAMTALAEWPAQPKRVASAAISPDVAMTTGTPSTMQLSPLPGGQNPYLRADSLAELLSWHDVDFVRCAFVTMLGRQPDPDGEAYYADRIRIGHSKLELLWQLRRSSEGHRHDPGIAGLDRALKRAALGRMKFVGHFIRPFTHTERDDPETRRWRSLANSIDYLRVSQTRQFALLNAKLESAAAIARTTTAEQQARVRPTAALSDRARDVFAAMVNVR